MLSTYCTALSGTAKCDKSVCSLFFPNPSCLVRANRAIVTFGTTHLTDPICRLRAEPDLSVVSLFAPERLSLPESRRVEIATSNERTRHLSSWSQHDAILRSPRCAHRALSRGVGQGRNCCGPIWDILRSRRIRRRTVLHPFRIPHHLSAPGRDQVAGNGRHSVLLFSSHHSHLAALFPVPVRRNVGVEYCGPLRDT
jgi:hypothetical protein